MVIMEEKGMKPILVNFGLAFALSFAGFLCSRLRIKTSPNSHSPTARPSGHESEVNLEEDIGATFSTSKTVSEEETCTKGLRSDNSSIALSSSSQQNGDKNEFLLPEFDELVKEVEFEVEVGSSRAYAGPDKDEYQQEISQLRNMVRLLQDKEQNLEVQLLEYCGLREQETVVIELQNRLKISNMEVKMFNLKVKNLQSENQRLKEQVVNHAKVLAELDVAKSKIELLNREISYEAEQNKERIVTLQQRVAKLQDQEYKDAACDQDIKIKLQKLKALESEVEELRKSNLKLQIENSDLARRLDSDLKRESERLRNENEGLMKQIEQLRSDRCSDLEELVYMRWINACLRYELRNYQPPPNKTVAKDLSKSLSPTSEKKAKQLILEYANTNEQGNIVDFDFDQCSSSQASSITDFGVYDDFSSVDNSSAARTNTTRQTKFFSKLRRLILGKDSNHHHSQVSSRYHEDRNSSRPSTSIGIDGRTSSDFSTLTSMNEGERRYSGSIVMGSSNKFSLGKGGSFSGFLGVEKSNLEKYAEALKDSSVNAKHGRRGRSVSYS
ncbi:protein CHUP1, chloroplastic-like isoform X2 [Cicer arietinum]|uniref:Protein CHUP1, chloroplastic-like isoform X2 n=1 Tax=Cicer arietinum TaxID=3827 RepID=A0A1S2XE12_CICAR|nr:protein CHUP1, chloroplastic-like isoform X2 [Cicer arietinum]